MDVVGIGDGEGRLQRHRGGVLGVAAGGARPADHRGIGEGRDGDSAYRHIARRVARVVDDDRDTARGLRPVRRRVVGGRIEPGVTQDRLVGRDGPRSGERERGRAAADVDGVTDAVARGGAGRTIRERDGRAVNDDPVACDVVAHHRRKAGQGGPVVSDRRGGRIGERHGGAVFDVGSRIDVAGRLTPDGDVVDVDVFAAGEVGCQAEADHRIGRLVTGQAEGLGASEII